MNNIKLIDTGGSLTAQFGSNSAIVPSIMVKP